MSELKILLERLAERGTRRGADAVLGAALAEIERTAEDPTTNGHRAVTGAATVSDPLEISDAVGAESDDDVVVPAVSMEDARLAGARRPWRSALAAAGLAALLGVGTLGISSLLSGGGASSPEEAVRRLVDAIEAEDPLAAVDVLAPAEVRGLRDAVEATARRAQELSLVNDAASPLAGVDLDVVDLDLSSEELAPGFAKVTLQAARIDAQARPDEMSELAGQAWRGWAEDDDGVWSETYDAADLRTDVQPFVIAVREGGGWYVSPAYTALEWIRVVNDLPPADFGSGVEAAGGADTPEAAVEGALDALAANDWDRLWGYAAPSELPLYDYRDALRELIGDSRVDVTVDELSAQAEVDGDVALVTVTGSGTYSDGGRWTADAECVRFVGRVAPAADDGCPELEPAYAFDLVGRNDDGTVTAVASGPVTVVQRDGRWYLSPIATVTDAVAAAVDRIDERNLYTILGLEALLPADGELTLGREVTIPARTRSPLVYEFDGRAGQRVVGAFEADPTDEYYWGGFASGAIVGPDGEEVPDSFGVLQHTVVELPQDGRYRLIVRPYGTFQFDVRFTLYDAESAPEEVLNPPDPCAGDGAPAWCVPPEVVSRECTEGGVAVDCDARPGPGVEREICETWDDGNRSCFTERYDVSVGDEPGAPGVEAPNEGWAPTPPEAGG
jgi:hypothetical protein